MVTECPSLNVLCPFFVFSSPITSDNDKITNLKRKIKTKPNKRYTKHGTGQQTWSDAAQYTGQYKGGKLSGDGVFRWPTGEEYEGDWASNQMEGKGVFTFASGATFEGDFQCAYGKRLERCILLEYVYGDVFEGHLAGV